jgi:hypothetical protein
MFPSLFRLVPDGTYLKILFRIFMDYPLNLENPKTFNEKIQWIKLNDRRAIYTECTDKYAVRKFVKERIGEEYLIPLLGVWNKAQEIDFSSLPDQFAIKCNHDCGSVLICKNKNEFNIRKAIRHFMKKLDYNYYDGTREWAYKDIQRKIVAEQLILDKSGNVPADCKIHCFNSEPKYVQLISNRFTDGVRAAFYDVNWVLQEFTTATYPNTGETDAKPVQLEKMLELAKNLSEDFAYVRMDFYIANNEQVYFSEMAFYPASGYSKFVPEKFGMIWGNLIKLGVR